MSSKELKKKAEELSLVKGGKHEYIRTLILKGYFDLPKSTLQLIDEIRRTRGRKWKTIEVQTYMKKFMEKGIIHAVRPHGLKGNFWVLANIHENEALRLIGQTKKVREASEDLFSGILHKKLKKYFRIEFEDLQNNFGRSGTCSAFLLRKILEKLIYITFAKNKTESQLEDKSRAGGMKGLEEMINIAATQKLNGIPFLIPKTANSIKGVKFLGDASAHNPLMNVDMKTIIPQMPFIITAYEELAKRL